LGPPLFLDLLTDCRSLFHSFTTTLTGNLINYGCLHFLTATTKGGIRVKVARDERRSLLDGEMSDGIGKEISYQALIIRNQH
jgi:hypothetical protein